MKRLAAVLSIITAFTFFAVTLAVPVWAQNEGDPDEREMQENGMMQNDTMQGGMMQMMQGMHQQMMQNPIHRAHMMTFMLPALADTLGLSDEQLEQINEIKSERMTQRQDYQEQMMMHRQEFMDLFEGDESPDLDAVRPHLMAMAEHHANQQAATYETAQEMHQVLTAEQRQTLEGLTPQQQMHQMMARMSMMDMMDMMDMMRPMDGRMMGGETMMGRGMMQNMPMGRGGMMRQGGMQNMPQQQNRQNP